MKIERYDIVIVGTGAAGLYAALSFPLGIRILMITKEELEKSDSFLAQGGISTLLGREDYDDYYKDTLEAGHYENKPEAVREMMLSSQEIIQKLMDYGVEFDYDEIGNISYTREGGHSKKRILHHQDITGKEIVTKLLQRAKEREGIILHEYEQMIDLLIHENMCYGILAINKVHEMTAYYAKSVILATGGLGGLFRNSTNFPHITGDSIAIGLRHQILLENLHYIQIHPTTLYSSKKGRRFLISESVRGEGAMLYNEEGKRFVDELLPRDKVTQAIVTEMEKHHTDHVYLSFEGIKTEQILSHFPNIYRRCLEEGYDVTKEKIPITPAQHYLMGGIQTGLSGETSVKRLYAVGETACNGVHGTNRLASNSLLESLVFARNAARSVVNNDMRYTCNKARYVCNDASYSRNDTRLDCSNASYSRNDNRLDCSNASYSRNDARLDCSNASYSRNDARHHYDNVTRNSIQENEAMCNIDFYQNKINISQYKDLDVLQEKNKELIFAEIKRKDEAFYDKWCKNENKSR